MPIEMRKYDFLYCYIYIYLFVFLTVEDIERNDGTPDKPYFMSSGLRAIFEKQD